MLQTLSASYKSSPKHGSVFLLLGQTTSRALPLSTDESFHDGSCLLVNIVTVQRNTSEQSKIVAVLFEYHAEKKCRNMEFASLEKKINNIFVIISVISLQISCDRRQILKSCLTPFPTRTLTLATWHRVKTT